MRQKIRLLINIFCFWLHFRDWKMLYRGKFFYVFLDIYFLLCALGVSLQIVKCKCTAPVLFTNSKVQVYCTFTVYKLEIKSVLHLYCLQILCKCTTHVLFTSWKLENWKIVSVLNLYCLQIVNCKCTAPVLFSNFKV